MTDEEMKSRNERLVDDYISWVPLKEMYATYGMTRANMYRILKRYNVTLRGKSRMANPANVATAIAMHMARATLSDIAKRVHSTPAHISAILHNHGYVVKLGNRKYSDDDRKRIGELYMEVGPTEAAKQLNMSPMTVFNIGKSLNLSYRKSHANPTRGSRKDDKPSDAPQVDTGAVES